MSQLSPDTLTAFTKRTKFPIKAYLRRVIAFEEFHRNNIYAYYAGESKSPNMVSFNTLSALLDESQRLENIIENKRNSFSTLQFWELIELLSDIYTRLQTINNASKWLRSAITKNNFNPSVEVDYTLQQLQTIESVAEDAGSQDRDTDWVSIALRNDLEEEAYTTQGGNVLKVAGLQGATIKLNSVVDNISGKKVYGIDLDQTLTFVDDDLKALSYDDTMKQSVKVLASLKQGMTPEFPDDGIGVLVGNRNDFSYPILMRQVTATFTRDDTMKSLRITDIGVREDALFLSFEVKTRLGEEYNAETDF